MQNFELVILLVFIAAVVGADLLSSCRANSRNLNGETFDFIIVGSGHAGSVLAKRLSESGQYKVLLLEAGKSYDPSIDLYVRAPALFSATFNSATSNWGYYTTNQVHADNATRFVPRVKAVGGCSLGNANIYNRGTKEDYDGWADELNDPSWKFQNLLSYFKKSEKNLDTLRSDLYHGRTGEWTVSNPQYVHESTKKARDAALQAGELTDQEHSDGTANGLTFNQVTIANGVRNSVDIAFLAPIVNRPNLYIKPEAHVKKILFMGNEATGLIFKDSSNGGGGGALKTVYASREIILSAGAIGSPQLLLVSGVGPKSELESKGIQVVANSPKVGKELHDHVLVGVSVRMPELETLDKNIALNYNGIMNEWNQNKTGPLTSNVAEMTGLYKSYLANAYFSGKPDMQYITAPALYVKQASVKQPGNYSYTFAVSLAAPLSRGEVTLASADSEVAPLINPNYFADQKDLLRLREAIKRIRNILSQPAIASHISYEMYPGSQVVTDSQIDTHIKEFAASGNHLAGSLRMGKNKNKGPLDSNLCVRGVKKVRVADASVMPTIIRTNPASTVVMIGERAAENALKAAQDPNSSFVCSDNGGNNN